MCTPPRWITPRTATTWCASCIRRASKATTRSGWRFRHRTELERALLFQGSGKGGRARFFPPDFADADQRRAGIVEVAFAFVTAVFRPRLPSDARAFAR